MSDLDELATGTNQSTLQSTAIETEHVNLMETAAHSISGSWQWAAAIGLLAAAATLPLAREPLLRSAAAIAIVVLLGCLVALRYLRRMNEQHAQRLSFALACLAAGASTPLVLMYNLSGAAMGFALVGLLVYSMQAPAWNAIAVASFAAIPHVVVHVLMTFRIIGPLGMLVPEGHYFAGELSSLQSVAFFYVLSVGVGQVLRRRTNKELERLAEAGREIAARDALIREARRELEDAAGVGEPGRFTGHSLAGFSLGTILGRGGMGEIYVAQNESTGKRAAVKLLRPMVDDPRAALTRFGRESEILAQLDSPHLVKVLAVGGMEAELPFIAMELLEGADLRTILRSERRLELADVSAMISQCATALTVIERQGVIHRDIKPSNLFRTTEGIWKVLDFGVARLAGGGSTLTGTKLVGTPSYMAPEQVAETSEIDHRTDVYALGAVAYRCLTGRAAFLSRDLGLLLHEITDLMPIAPGELADIDSEVEDVLRIALAKDPSDRFQSAEAFAKALSQAAQGRLSPPIAERAMSLNATQPWRTTDDLESEVDPTQRRSMRPSRA